MKLKGALDSAIATLFSASLGLLMLGTGEGGPKNANVVPGMEGGMSDVNDAATLASVQDMLKSKFRSVWCALNATVGTPDRGSREQVRTRISPKGVPNQTAASFYSPNEISFRGSHGLRNLPLN